MHSRIVGDLIADTEFTWRKSKDVLSKHAIATPCFNNKAVSYRFAFNEHKDLTLEAADEALEHFFNITLDLKREIAEKAFENWVAFNNAVGYLDGIETFSNAQNRPEWMEQALQHGLWLKKLKDPKQVWAYLNPSEISITKDRYNKREGVFVQIICQCDWQEEHGLQIVLKNGNELIRVSTEDGNLFDYYDQNGNPIED